jgi:phosphoglycolate phosphatase-like HAD superfamily hydrolase
LPSPSRLILFDIDGTLLTAGGAPRRAFRRALTLHFGTSGDEARTDFSGKTDPQIVYEIMRGAGFEDDRIEAGIAELFAHYLEGLEQELPQDSSHRLHPGAAEVVEVLAADPRVLLGLVTGNVERGARLKLEPPGLNRYFLFGAFGSDSPDRYLLPAVAIERARQSTGRIFAGKSVVIVGDSIHDVACGRSLGVRSVAVATGPTSRDRLLAEKPDAFFEDFSDVGRAYEAILS